MKKKIKLKKLIILLFAIISLCGLIYSGYNIFIWKKSIDKNTSIKEKIEESITIIENEDTYKYEIDFASLKKENPDTVAYLKVNNTNIDYIIVRGNDNNYYLKHNFYKEYNVAGWIFSDYKNKFDGTDKNIVIFGHNMKDGSMFGTLTNILNKAWQENKDNLQVVLATEKGTSLYEVFSVYSILPEEYYINTEFTNDDEYSKFLKKIKNRSVYNYDVDITSSDNILTLSTCTGNGKKRIVLHARKI